MIAAVNGIEMYYETYGQGRPLLLVHGNGDDLHFFDSLRPLAEQHCTVYAADSRGHGQSTPADELSYVQMADDLAAFIKELQLEKPLLIGSSDGGILGLLLDIRHPGLLGGQAVCGANTTPDGVKARFCRMVQREYRQTHDPKLRLMLEEPQITPEMLAQITVPTLVMAGSRDLIRTRHTKALAAHVPGAELAILRGEDHTSYLKEHAAKGWPLMLGFFRRHGLL